MPNTRSTAFPTAFSATTTGRVTSWIARMMGAIVIAVRSACCKAIDFGTISPITMWKYVRIATAITLPRVCAATHRPAPRISRRSASHAASRCSPYMPRPRLASVIPSWAVAMNRSCELASAKARATSRARHSPRSARRWIAGRGAPTIANSAATKSALSNSSAVQMSTGTITSLIRRLPRTERGVDRDDHADDRSAVHTLHFHLHARQDHHVSDGWHLRHRRRDDPTHGCAALRPGSPRPARRLIDRHVAGKPNAPIRQPLSALVGGAELVGDISDQVVQDIVDRDEPRRAAELVEQNRHRVALFLEAHQDTVGGERGGQHECRLHDRSDRSALCIHRERNVAHVDDADHLVDRPVVHGQTGERTIQRNADRFGQGRVS